MLLNHPANLLLRLVLEIVGLVSIGQWGLNQTEGWPKYLLGFGLAFVVVLLWYLFNPIGEPWRMKPPVIVVPGRFRLILETLMCMIAIAAMLLNGSMILAAFFVFALLIHCFWSIDRIVWLAKN